MSSTNDNVELPPYLLSLVDEGSVVLMLGAGASFGSKDGKGKEAPGGKELARLLATRFLPSTHHNLPLDQVADYAIDASDLFTVQNFISELLTGLRPTETHKRLASYRWRSIVTTNYDTLVEKGYEAAGSAVQKIVPFIDNTDRIDEKIRSAADLALFKLHGCITRINNERCPLILSTDQYVNYSSGRDRLFGHFKELASQRSVVFIGYRLQDINIRQILSEIDTTVPSRPRFFLISPEVTDTDIQFWAKKKITAIAGTFASFIQALDRSFKSPFTGLRSSAVDHLASIADHLKRKDTTLSVNAREFLSKDVDVVRNISACPMIDPNLFYKGVNQEWSPIEQELDVNRHLADTILIDHFLEEAATDDLPLKLIVVKAHAGAGKTVMLRRMAWEAAKTHKKLSLFLKSGGILNVPALAELSDQTDETVYLFIDNILERRREIENLFSSARNFGGRLTLVTAARTNEWNQAPESLASLVTDEYELPYLSRKEIERLLKLLETHKALGRLESLTDEGRIGALHDQAGRQLLVALHEATLGKAFEEIIRDEFDKIQPYKAKKIYLSICLMNQFNVPVRAGIIARRFGITFEEFQRDFFSPLEQIIVVDLDEIERDHTYSARHPHIAEIVVKLILNHEQDLFNEILESIKYLNLAYRSDQKTFQRLIRARTLMEQFKRTDRIQAIYEIAGVQIRDDAFLYQQKGIFEMIRHDGDLAAAEALINRAKDLAKHSKTIQHTEAEIYLRKGEQARHRLEQEKAIEKVRQICSDLKRRDSGPFPYYTLVKLGIMQVKTWGTFGDERDEDLTALTSQIDKVLKEGMQKFPDNPQLYAVDSELAKTLSQSDRALNSMSKSFDLNPKNSSIALRLAGIYKTKGNYKDAHDVLRKALEHRRTDPRLNYSFAKLLFESDMGRSDDILYHLERSYITGDQNYEEQLLHGRQLYAANRVKESKAVFSNLKKARVDAATKRKPRLYLNERFTGRIKSMDVVYCLIERDKDGDWVDLQRSNVDQGVWDSLSIGSRVQFTIAFNYFGATAVQVKLT